MAEVIYTMPNMARNTQGEREEGIEDNYDSIESLRDQHQDYVGTEESSNTLGTVRSQQPDPVSPPRCPIRAVVVLLVLLSLTLLAGLLRFVMQNKNICMDRDVEQLLQRLKNVTEQRDSLLCKQDCPGGWNKFGCKCYQVTREWGSWNKSRELCVSKGADLVVVDSKEEMDFINRYGGDFWLGATDEASDGLWRWSDGTVLSAYNPSWRRGKPDGDKDKNCLRTAWEKTNYKWTVGSCKDASYGICEYNLMK
ncbi:galactose-specific lectin nattectin-like [Gadus morhua]|uniref:galactose-specific lectin nattectin-like n=1 Tax=Gadus morhua TaxID=8049 RepID=UPI0011B6F4CE|nr:galactose-specific lectin nattectin-like [Gadus morhua]